MSVPRKHFKIFVASDGQTMRGKYEYQNAVLVISRDQNDLRIFYELLFAPILSIISYDYMKKLTTEHVIDLQFANENLKNEFEILKDMPINRNPNFIKVGKQKLSINEEITIEEIQIEQ